MNDNLYIYHSEKLVDIVSSNNSIDNKNYVYSFLEWLEKNIPEDCRDNFYRNIKSLKTNLNLDIDLNKEGTNKEIMDCGGYNTVNNSITIGEDSLRQIWNIAKTTSNPNEIYYRQYASTLLHELCHVSSTNYNSETKTTLCGFDKYPAEKESDKNRGLTEGYTEVIAMCGVPGTVEMASSYYIEACIINQLIRVLGNNETLNRAYFSNQGIKPLEDKLNEIINDKEKSSSLFRNIETNFNIRNNKEQQNVLYNVQNALLDYLDKKLEALASNNQIDEINNAINYYDAFIIDSRKLVTIKKDPSLYTNIDSNLERFNEIKSKYQEYLIENSMSK